MFICQINHYSFLGSPVLGDRVDVPNVAIMITDEDGGLQMTGGDFQVGRYIMDIVKVGGDELQVTGAHQQVSAYLMSIGKAGECYSRQVLIIRWVGTL